MIELLSPAGDFETLKSVLDFGADAVYVGSKAFGMRAGAKNFDFDELKKAVQITHQMGRKIYLTANTLPYTEEIEIFPEFLRNADSCEIDAIICADIGVLSLVKKYAPNLEIHISTQAGIVNHVTANAFYEMGAKRIVLAREVPIADIERIREKIPSDMEIETFVHGAMCMSFSGRCLISQYMVGRDANRGQCAQPCRWKYYVIEEKRLNKPFELEETDEGTYMFNAKDLCMINHLSELKNAGVNSFKIEGRGKSSYYSAVITNAYRMALDFAKRGEPLPQWISDEVNTVSHRNYCTGFYFNHPDACQYYENSGYIRTYDFVGTVDFSDGKYLHIIQRNYFKKGEVLEILSPQKKPIEIEVNALLTEDFDEIEIARHPLQKLLIECELDIAPNSIIRRKAVES